MADFQPPTDARSAERVTRCAPRWAWAVVDALLALHGDERVVAAREALCDGCDEPDE